MVWCLSIILVISMAVIIICQAVIIHRNSVDADYTEWLLQGQKEYCVFLNDVLEVNNVEGEPFEIYLSSYLYPNLELENEYQEYYLKLGLE